METEKIFKSKLKIREIGGRGGAEHKIGGEQPKEAVKRERGGAYSVEPQDLNGGQRGRQADPKERDEAIP